MESDKETEDDNDLGALHKTITVDGYERSWQDILFTENRNLPHLNKEIESSTARAGPWKAKGKSVDSEEGSKAEKNNANEHMSKGVKFQIIAEEDFDAKYLYVDLTSYSSSECNADAQVEGDLTKGSAEDASKSNAVMIQSAPEDEIDPEHLYVDLSCFASLLANLLMHKHTKSTFPRMFGNNTNRNAFLTRMRSPAV